MGETKVIVLGAGPAGLAAAYELTRHGLRPTVLERQDRVGGLARTEQYRGFYFDMGGHRFFTQSPEVSRLWREMLGEDFLRRQRLSRILYRGRFFYYPLRPLNTLAGLGLTESARIIASYLRWQLVPYPHEETFEQWVTNRFGRRLFETFFKSYTEKVWGIPCSQLKAEWAAQRIKDLSFKSALFNMFRPSQENIRTLIDVFDYPRLGPGMMWRAFQERIESAGGSVRLNSEVVAIHRTGNHIDGVSIRHQHGLETITGTDFISSIPVTALIKRLEPAAPAQVRHAAGQLRHRDFLTVCLIVHRKHLFPDNWIYVHDPEVRVGRIQNFKNWSPDMVPDPTMTSLGLEYFCDQSDSLWRMSDPELIELGKIEIERLGLAEREAVMDGCVFRAPQSYPVYDAGYAEALATVRSFVETLENLQTIGRNGLHRYNNQDHAVLTGLSAARNLLFGELYDLWAINADQRYQEEGLVALDSDRDPDQANGRRTNDHRPRITEAGIGHYSRP